MYSRHERMDQLDGQGGQGAVSERLRTLGRNLYDRPLTGGLRWVITCLSGLTLLAGCAHHDKCPPPGDCVGYPSGLCAGYYPTCWRLWPAECPSCPVEPAPVAVPTAAAPAPSETSPVLVPEEGYLSPEQAPPPEIPPQSPPASSNVSPRGRRLQPIRSRPVPRVDDSTSAGPPPRPIVQNAPRVEPTVRAASTEATVQTAVRVVAEMRPLPPVQEVPAVRAAATRVSPAPVEWGQLIAELPSAKPIAPLVPAQTGPVMPVFAVPARPAVRPVQRKPPEPGSGYQPTVRAAGPMRR